ncbi:MULTISPECIES: xanthine dehydrogenase family protein molybdopterin-binding subunit [unclassified Mycolicibacterium]|uniref:xanthine dehydrogenase family protein molybdopterin-binding subunit n=1 Tax=unclassified Mycolicibacterium TaxID=2636767 RepID=UPI0012DE2C5C|nr:MULTISPECIES: xanthine dehydrogenase family protein molybdopterin-binding subunit [unclassified Mycolicibacterium]MUL80670.1 xanthine dehydrogenase family protein [Mycolicibacterium sp. CBMA 329]MUL86437.1 xanthine dehydrogenase family protein [Mycolicibacterium sp. CBMA 331]MUM01299.1 xanthine dehydrogenase family protein [Mycolicibacterium sp. CBMA 334]MUM29034.1 xanthine dehydrogenase family protein [Mycolicibacterium sp. CBMA 295]MUM36733.1 xanthine dehydrogenase family protein [Mycolic
MIGSRAKRIEDPVLLRGAGRFAADTTHAGELHMRVVRSPVAYGRLVSVDVSAALLLDGVVAAWTYTDIDSLPAISFRLTPRDELLPYRQPVLARRFVRYVGEPVAVVFATSAYLAEDAAELVAIDIEPLEARIDADLEPVEWIDAEQATWAAGTGMTLPGQDSEATCFVEEYGDVEAAFAGAESLLTTGTHRVFEMDARIGRHTGVPMECRGLVAAFDKAEQVLVVDGAAKVPFWNREAIAAITGLPPHQVLVRETHVGGGFGPRGELYPEDVLVTVAAMRLRRPVKWIEDRQEHLVATNHSRGQHHRLRALVRVEDGWIEALDADFILDQGAYVRTHGATVASLTASMLPGPYVIPHFRATAHVRLTNKTPAGTYRSPGRYEGTFARERLVDKIARELQLDPAELRRTNFIPASKMPYERPIQAMGTHLIHDSGDYELLLDKVSAQFDFASIRTEVEARRAAGELVGFGFGFFVEKSGIGPFEGARVSVDASGHVTISCGASSVGQGVDTVLAQIVADRLQIPHHSIRVVRGRTDQFQYGRGAFATRLAVMAGSAAAHAADALAEKACRAAAHHFRVSTAEVELVDGAVVVIEDNSKTLTLGEAARLLEPMGAGEMKEEPGLSADGWFRSDHMTYPYGLHAALVSIDRGTGRLAIERFIVGYDVGRALNPMLVEGQIAGGVAQGIGGAVYEEFLYSEDGTPMCTTFMDYLIPTVLEIPDVEILVTEDAPSPINPLGVKGAGEGGTTAVAAAIASAVDDALRIPGAIATVPIRPDLLCKLAKSISIT